MFLHVNRTKIKGASGYYKYLRILETYYENGKHKQRVMLNLGRVDKIGPQLDKLVDALAQFTDKKMLAESDIEVLESLTCGKVLLARHLWEQLGLGRIIASRCKSARRKSDVAETAFVLVANRLSDPGSEHALARWLENTYVPDRNGNRWLPEWLPTDAITKQQRVRVRSRQLQKWYRTLDALLAGKEDIEQDLYRRVCDLFSLKVDIVFYDVTSTYFARRRPKGDLRRHGVSKDGRPRNVQVILGVVIANGWPISHHIFPGNTADCTTLPVAVDRVRKRFDLRRVLVVGDRGMVSHDTFQSLTADGREVRHLLGIRGRRSTEAAAVFDRLKDKAWITVDDGNRVQEVRLDDSDLRYFVVDSKERREYEQELRERSIKAAAEQLDKVTAAVKAGRLKAPEKIGARAGCAVSRNHGSRYYSWEVTQDGRFRYWKDDGKMKAEKVREGRYVLKTDDATITAEESVGIYKQLSDVEWAYRDLKDVIAMRPIYHKKDSRVCAHIFVATLALFLKRALQHELARQHIDLTPTEAFAAMGSIGVGVLDIAGKRRLVTSSGGRDAQRLVKALGIGKIDPPAPAAGPKNANR